MREIALAGLDYQISMLHSPTSPNQSLTYNLIELLLAEIDGVTMGMIREEGIKNSQFNVVQDGHYLVKSSQVKPFIEKIEGSMGKSDYRGV